MVRLIKESGMKTGPALSKVLPDFKDSIVCYWRPEAVFHPVQTPYQSCTENIPVHRMRGKGSLPKMAPNTDTDVSLICVCITPRRKYVLYIYIYIYFCFLCKVCLI